MKYFTLLIVNIAVIYIFIRLFRKKNTLSYFSGGKWWLTWLSIAVITLMDELTSIFYAPSEAFRFIGTHAIFFIAFTSILMRFLSTRMVEIAEILEFNGIKGGGVYSFSYFVLGPTVSFIAVASIMVDYILTACISTVSAISNGMSFINMPQGSIFMLQIAVIWSIALLNIIGIKENAKFTFGVFFIASIVFSNLITSGIFHVDMGNITAITGSVKSVGKSVADAGIFKGYGLIVVSIASCVLAYSGIESVVQTAGLVKSWKDIKKAYIFLALTVGIATPLITALVLSSNKINFAEHEGDLITHYATIINGIPFGLVVGFLASITLIMAVNTAYVASSELMERIAHRYNFEWLIKVNRRQSLYRIHICNAILYTTIILITSGSQKILADMYAVGLLASFCINMFSLIIYRYFKGTKDIHTYNTSRTGTAILFVILLSCFIYLASHKPYGTMIWAFATVSILIAGLRIAKKHAPEIKHIEQTDTPMELIFYMAEKDTNEYHLYFIRPQEDLLQEKDTTKAFISFFSPRIGIPKKIAENHFRFTLERAGNLYSEILSILYTIKYEFPDKKIVVHFGWPMSSWIDRASIGVMIFSIMKLPSLFPEYNFIIEYEGGKSKGLVDTHVEDLITK